MSDLRNITRIDIEPTPDHPERSATHGWQVRIRRGGTRHTKFFSDSRFGGSDGALDQARRYRDHLLGELPDATPPTARRAWSNTGVSGLSLRSKEGNTTDKYYVQLSWLDTQGKRHGAAFSVEKWGLRRALWNACLRLYREHKKAERPDLVEPHVNFAIAQERLRDQVPPELWQEPEQPEAPKSPPAPEPTPVQVAERLSFEQQAQARLEKMLFGS